jgi:hypothetical protein
MKVRDGALEMLHHHCNIIIIIIIIIIVLWLLLLLLLYYYYYYCIIMPCFQFLQGISKSRSGIHLAPMWAPPTRRGEATIKMEGAYHKRQQDLP